MVVYIGDVDVRTILHHGRVIVCCCHGGASLLATFSGDFPTFFTFTLLCLLLLLNRLLLGLFWLGSFVHPSVLLSSFVLVGHQLLALSLR